MPKLSVIIPVYNAENFLRETLDSVLNQSLHDIELICVDDGSTDHSREILREYEKKDPRVRIFFQQNQFAGPARNRGLEAATGEYVHFLDADDRILDYACEALYNRAVKYDLDVLRCAAVDWDVQRETFVVKKKDTHAGMRATAYNRIVGLEEGSPLFNVSVAPWAGITRRSFLMEKGIRFNRLRCVNDRSFYWRCVTNAERIMVARDRVIVHRISQGESLVGARAKNFDCQLRSVEINLAAMKEDRIAADIQERVLNAEFTDLLYWYGLFATGSYKDTVREITEAFVENYQGPCSGELRLRYRDKNNQIESETLITGEDRKARVTYQACGKPKVSVIVPVRNAEDHLNQMLHSLMVQKLREIEVICVDTGSTDGSMTILKEYELLDKRLRILDGADDSFGKAVNRGIDAARGEYVAILVPVDYITPGAYRSLYNLAVENQAEVVMADYFRFRLNREGGMDKVPYELTDQKNAYHRVICPADEPEAFSVAMDSWSGICKREFLNRRKIRLSETPGSFCRDQGFWFRVLCRAERVYFSDAPYYMKRSGAVSLELSGREKLKCIRDEYHSIEEWMTKSSDGSKTVRSLLFTEKCSSLLKVCPGLGPEDRRTCLCEIRDLFIKAQREGQIHKEEVPDELWRQLNEIAADPDAYRVQICVSVIIPVYNAQGHLRQMLDSILCSDEIPIEVICVDDGSTDESLAILCEYEEKDDRVRVITQENRGAGAARNTGMQYANGEYLSFLDADDFFEPDMLRLACQAAQRKHVDIIVFGSDQYEEETGRRIPTPYAINTQLLPAHQPFAGSEITVDVFKAFVGWAWDKLFRADFVRGNHLHFQEQRTTNDLLFVFSALIRADSIITMDKILAHHRLEKGSLSVTRELSWHCFYDALCALRQQMEDWEMFRKREQDFINYSLHFSLWNLNTIRGTSYYELYGRLRENWLEDLGIMAHADDPGYFYHRSEYQQLRELLNFEADEFLFNRRDGKAGEAGDLLIRKLRAKEKKIRALEGEIDGLKEDKRKIQESTTWKIGSMILRIPIKIKKWLQRR